MPTPPPNPALFASIRRLNALADDAAYVPVPSMQLRSDKYDAALQHTEQQLRRLLVDEEMTIAPVAPLFSFVLTAVFLTPAASAHAQSLPRCPALRRTHRPRRTTVHSFAVVPTRRSPGNPHHYIHHHFDCGHTSRHQRAD